MNPLSLPAGSKVVRDSTASEPGLCPECKSGGLVEDTHRGELICTGCGTVIERGAFDFSAEKRAYTAEEVENRKHKTEVVL